MFTTRKSVRLRAIRLTVVEVEEMLEALRSAKAPKNLNGRQRQNLDEAIGQLTKAMDRSVDDEAEISADTAAVVVRCIAMSQQWFQSMLAEFSGSDQD